MSTFTNPKGTPIEAFDAIRQGVSGDRSQFYKDLSEPFYGANRPGTQVSQGILDTFWLWSMQVGLKGAYDCIKAFSESDLTPTAWPRLPRTRTSSTPICWISSRPEARFQHARTTKPISHPNRRV